MSIRAGKVQDLRGVLMVGCSKYPGVSRTIALPYQLRPLDGYEKACKVYGRFDLIWR